LLSKEEEQFYFRRMNWLKFRAATVRGRLDRRRATLRQIDRIEGWLTEAETVKAIIITSNLRLVVSIAKKFVDTTNSFEELVGEGNVALMRAVEKFSFALGNRFSTYATYAIQRHFFRLSHKARQLRQRFVTDEESFKGLSAAEPNTEQCSFEQIATLKYLFANFLGELEPREQQIIVARFGFDGQPPRTFRELGASMGVCKERIRQIQTRAIDKLREMAAEVRLVSRAKNGSATSVPRMVITRGLRPTPAGARPIACGTPPSPRRQKLTAPAAISARAMATAAARPVWSRSCRPERNRSRSSTPETAKTGIAMLIIVAARKTSTSMMRAGAA
jgi:RNA polymerase sigma factor (sigma-70 family)